MKVTEGQTIVRDNVEPYRGGPKRLFIPLFTNEGMVGLGERVTRQATNLKSQIALLAELPDPGVQPELASQRDLQGADQVRERLHYTTVRPRAGRRVG